MCAFYQGGKKRVAWFYTICKWHRRQRKILYQIKIFRIKITRICFLHFATLKKIICFFFYLVVVRNVCISGQHKYATENSHANSTNNIFQSNLLFFFSSSAFILCSSGKAALVMKLQRAAIYKSKTIIYIFAVAVLLLLLLCMKNIFTLDGLSVNFDLLLVYLLARYNMKKRAKIKCWENVEFYFVARTQVN